jgi:hypothetical protein
MYLLGRFLHSCAVFNVISLALVWWVCFRPPGNARVFFWRNSYNPVWYSAFAGLDAPQLALGLLCPRLGRVLVDRCKRVLGSTSRTAASFSTISIVAP